MKTKITTYGNFGDVTEVVFGGKFIAVSACIKKEDRISNQ